MLSVANVRIALRATAPIYHNTHEPPIFYDYSFITR